MLPEIKPTLANFGEIRIGNTRAPVLASIGDQQAAAIGQGGVRGGDLCLNYGTGAFALLFTGEKLVRCRGLLSNIAWSSMDQRMYVLEGGVNAVGSGIEWLSGMLGLPKDLRLIERVARSARGSTRVLPAFAGLAAPYWDPKAEGLISGVSLATEKGDLVRGFLDGVAFLIAQIVRATPPSVSYRRIVAGGGLSVMNLLLELQAAHLRRPIFRARCPETSAWGAAALAGVGAGIWGRLADATRLKSPTDVFNPRSPARGAQTHTKEWERMVRAARGLGV
jgi:glycerol kinase